MASGWSMRVTRTSERISAQMLLGDAPGRPGRARATASRRRRSPTPARGRRGAARGCAAREVAARLGRRQQRQLVDHAHHLVELDRRASRCRRRSAALTRSRSRAMARRTRLQARLVGARQALVGLLQRGHQRLGAAGDRGLLQRQRAPPLRCRPRRFSSRERDSDCIRSSSWVRCSATSVEARLEQRDLGARRRARRPAPGARAARASVTWPALSCWRLHELALAAAHALVGAARRSTMATTASSASSSDRERPAPRGSARRRVGGVGRRGRGRRAERRATRRDREARRRAKDRRSRSRSIVCRRPPRPAPGAASTHVAEAGPRARAAMRGWVASARARAPAARRRQRAARLAIASELLNSQTCVAGAASAASSAVARCAASKRRRAARDRR